MRKEYDGKEGIRIEVRNIDGRKEWGSKDSLGEERKE